MIAAVGIHIVDLARFRETLTERFIQNVFLPGEVRYAGSRARGHESYAGRYAAKEAVLRALVPGGAKNLPLNQVEVLRNDDSGEVSIRLHGKAAAAAAEMGVDAVRVSISHCGTTALALVILERGPEGKGMP